MSMTEQTANQEGVALKLWIEDDAGGKASYPLMHQELSIGRDEVNEICLTQRNISRQHAQMTLQSDQRSLLVRDLESYTGIKLNGKRVAGQCTFRQGDFIEIGGYILSLEGPESAQAAESAPAPVEPLPPEAHARLIAVSSNLAGQEYSLNQRELIIGREPAENDMVIHHRSVSRSHAKIVWRDGVFSVIDLRSSNGIFVNGSAFRAAKLVTGDIITLGHVKLRFVAPGDPYVFSPADVEHIAVEQSSQLKPIIIMVIAAALAWYASQRFSALKEASTDAQAPAASEGQPNTGDNTDSAEPSGASESGTDETSTTSGDEPEAQANAGEVEASPETEELESGESEGEVDNETAGGAQGNEAGATEATQEGGIDEQN